MSRKILSLLKTATLQVHLYSEIHSYTEIRLSCLSLSTKAREISSIHGGEQGIFIPGEIRLCAVRPLACGNSSYFLFPGKRNHAWNSERRVVAWDVLRLLNLAGLWRLLPACLCSRRCRCALFNSFCHCVNFVRRKLWISEMLLLRVTLKDCLRICGFLRLRLYIIADPYSTLHFDRRRVVYIPCKRMAVLIWYLHNRLYFLNSSRYCCNFVDQISYIKKNIQAKSSINDKALIWRISCQIKHILLEISIQRASELLFIYVLKYKIVRYIFAAMT